MNTDNFTPNRLFSGIHASMQHSYSNTSYTSAKESPSLFPDNASEVANEASNEITNIDNVNLIKNVRSKLGTGNFASIFGSKIPSIPTPLTTLNNSDNIAKISPINALSNGKINPFSRKNLPSPISITDSDVTRDIKLKSIFKTRTIEYIDIGLPKLEDTATATTANATNKNNNNNRKPLSRLPNGLFDEQIIGLDDCVYVDLTDVDNSTQANEYSLDSNVNSSDNDSECSTNIGNDRRFHKSMETTGGYADTSYEFLNSETYKFDESLKQLTSSRANHNTVEKLLKVISERDEEIIQIRLECAQLNNYITTLPTRESIMDQIRNEMLSSIALGNGEITNLKSENQSLKLRLLDMESLQCEKDNKIKQLIFECSKHEQEICKLNRNIKLMQLNLENEKAEKIEQSLESLKNQKEERLRGRLEWSKKLELQKFDNIQIEKISNDRLHKIRGLEKSLNELTKKFNSSIENEMNLKRIVKDQNEKLEKYHEEIVELKSLLLVAKSQKSLINKYQSKLEELTCQLDNEKFMNQKDQTVKTLADEAIRNTNKLNQSFQNKINAIVDKIRSKGKSIQVDWIRDDFFNVQGGVVQVKLIAGNVCALKNGTPFPLELLLLN